MRFTLAWAFFIAGDLVSRLPDWVHWYPLYYRLMMTADRIQGAGPGPWRHTDEQNEG